VRHAEHGNLAFAQKALAGAVQVVEVAALAVGDEGVGHTFQHGFGVVWQLGDGIALPGLAGEPQVAQRGQGGAGRQHGVDQQADGAALAFELQNDGGIAQVGDEHGRRLGGGNMGALFPGTR
jgi:hypothetical protein